MEISIKVKKRFCKDSNLPISVLREPWFSNRIGTLDKYYGTLEQWELFKTELEKYDRCEDYLDDWDTAKEAAAKAIEGSEGYRKLHNRGAVATKQLSNRGVVYCEENCDRSLLSIDLIQANYNVLKDYDATIFGDTESWEEFVSQFTKNKFIVNSKRFREIVLNRCLPNVIIAREQGVISSILASIEDLVSAEGIVSVLQDEIVLDLAFTNESAIIERLKGYKVRIESFRLRKLRRVHGYYKDYGGGKFELKAVGKNEVPLAIAELEGREPDAADKVFWHEGSLAMYVGNDMLQEIKCLAEFVLENTTMELDDVDDEDLIEELANIRDAIDNWQSIEERIVG